MKTGLGTRPTHPLSIWLAAAFSVLLFVFPAPELSGDDLPYRFQARIHLLSFESDLDRLSHLGYDIAGIDASSSTVYLVVTSEEYHRLVDIGYNVQLLPVPPPFKRSPAAKAPAKVSAANIIIDDGYHHCDQVESILRQFQTAFPNIALMVDIGTSHYGRTIWALKISDNVAVDEDEPAIMFNGLHHARELMTTEVVLDTIQYLTTMYRVDPDVTRWVNTWEIWLIPIVNPDGNDIVFNMDANWRKNARDNNLNGVIDNSDGVDLNRNYPFKWGLTPGSSGVPSSSTYRGDAPASEPETQAVIDLSLRERFVFSVAYHSFGGVVLFPYGSMAATNPIPNISRSVCADFANSCVREDGRPYDLRPRLYDVNGLDRDWHYHNGTVGFVVEMGIIGFQADYDTWRDAIVEGLRPGWQYLLDRIQGPSIFGHVEDEQSGLPVSAAISIDEIQFFEGEIKTSDPYTGRYHWIVDPGVYNVSFSASGYISQSFSVTVEDDAALNLKVALQQESASVSDAQGKANTNGKDAPPTFALLQNYPNPANPGTWLPFKLSVPEYVIIRIYNSAGQLIRTLDLGQRQSGTHLSKEKAAYWDGKNEAGEAVISDIYFYIIEAGEFTGLRKMFIAR